MAERQAWRYVADDGVGAAFGLAADEMLMAGYGEPGALRPPTLRLYTYRSHCALVGRFQNVAAEIDLDVCRDEGIAVNRRPTGGGAIVMGSGQLGLALVGRLGEAGFPKHPAQLFESLVGGVVEGLRSMGLEARFRPRNDVEVGGKKIAGLGCTVDDGGAALFHTSLLVSADFELMARVLKVAEAKWTERAVASFSERLTTVEAERPGTTLKEARRAVRAGYEAVFGLSTVEEPWSSGELEAIGRLVEATYGTEAWVHQPLGRAQAHGRWEGRTEAGLLWVELALDGDVIKEARLGGDFFGSDRAVRDIEAALKWQRAEGGAIERAVREAWREGALLGLGPEELAASICRAAESVDAGAAAKEVK